VQEAARGSRGRLNVALTSRRFLPRCCRAACVHSARIFRRSRFSLSRWTALSSWQRCAIGASTSASPAILGASLERRLESRELVTCPMVAVLPTGHGCADGSGANFKKGRREDLGALGERESLACQIGPKFKLCTKTLSPTFLTWLFLYWLSGCFALLLECVSCLFQLVSGFCRT
jgi:hypothetical protein